ncbi:hypothetical protein [Planomonospora sp. ID82291]|uniref:hypothetical protein n=1 Tax=Planomonospora sp. ID82291 TaxID=2738136 RepID=UPI0018C42A0A|nr:hypothetical protein [Planomonospora sp. ID82291]MBG0818314.1 hypothetical protein [Planomonospora sp. ID82291]
MQPTFNTVRADILTLLDGIALDESTAWFLDHLIRDQVVDGTTGRFTALLGQICAGLTDPHAHLATRYTVHNAPPGSPEHDPLRSVHGVPHDGGWLIRRHDPDGPLRDGDPAHGGCWSAPGTGAMARFLFTDVDTAIAATHRAVAAPEPALSF